MKDKIDAKNPLNRTSWRIGALGEPLCILLAIFVILLFGEITEVFGQEPLVAKYVILLIADGWGAKHIEAANQYCTNEGICDATPTYQDPDWNPAGALWEKEWISTYPYGGSYNTNSAWNTFNYVLTGTVTDSAAAASVLYSGVKTDVGNISVSHNDAGRLFSIGEKAKDLGKGVGAVTTVPLSDATPGAWVAHNNDRGNYFAIADEGFFGDPNTTGMAAPGNKYEGHHGATLPPADVLIGDARSTYVNSAIRAELQAQHNSGNLYYVNCPGTGGDPAGADGDSDGINDDGDSSGVVGDNHCVGGNTVNCDDNCVNTGNADQADSDSDGFGDICDCQQLLMSAANSPGDMRIAGLFERPCTDLAGCYINNPTLSESLTSALTLLGNTIKYPNGAVLMFEGGAVDWAGHSNDMESLIKEMRDFNDAVDTVINWVNDGTNASDWSNTLVIVTGDHECGYLTPKSGTFPDQPLGLVNNDTVKITGTCSSDKKGEKIVSGSGGRRASWNDLDCDNVIDGGETVYWAWNSGGHSNSLIPLYCRGVGCNLFSNYYETMQDLKRGYYLDNRHVWTVMNTVLIDVPLLSSPSVSGIDTGSAALGATIDSDGSASISSRGTVWDLSPFPTVNEMAEGGTAMGAFSHVRTGLPEGSLIYYRGYAANAAGNGYAPEGSFYTEPTQVSDVVVNNVTDTSMHITWTDNSANSSQALVLMREGSPVVSVPVDGNPYLADSIFGNGEQLGTGNYVIFAGSGTQVDVTGLSPWTTYHVAIYAYAGAGTMIDYQQDAPGVASRESCTDTDGDTYAIEGGGCGTVDCNDSDIAINPGAAEVCDGTDNDCNAGTVDGSGEAAPLNDLQAGVCAGSVKTCVGAAGWQNNYSGVSNYEAVEASCDSLDNDCDSQTDEGLTTTYYEDSDSDTYGNALVTQVACTQPGGYAANNTDCNDTNGLINPGATEVCDGTDNDCNAGTADGSGETAPLNDLQAGVCTGSVKTCAGAGGWQNNYSGVSNYEAVEASCDSLDNDCDSQTDEGLTTTYYEDSDSDTYGNALVTQVACTQPGGYAANNTDCNDTNGLINPGATEICDGTDNDCNAGTVDGTGEAAPLNDLQAGVCTGSVKTCAGAGGWQNNYSGVSNYEAVETSCDSLDNDCDSQTDEGLKTTYYEDFDSDTYGNALVTQVACTQPGGYAANNTDCNDTNGLINPGATEVCDGTDNDCNAGTADGSGETAPLNDLQAGVCAGSVKTCAGAGGWQNNYSGVSNYEAVEASCDSLDNDCDSQTDEGLTTTYYEDSDSDTYGNALVTQVACTQPGGYAANNTDCNDTNGLINPGATEICDGTDNDCNAGTVDGTGEAAPDNSNQQGVCAGSKQSCAAGAWTDDYSGVSNYEAVEASCDSLDNDCDSQTDEGLTTTYYEDSDSDTYGNALVTQEACTQPGGYAANNTDCNDTNGLINPGATEICDGTDNDCNAGTVDGTGEAAPDNSNQQGVCAGSKQSCAAEAWTDDYSGVSNYEAVEASCDSLDNDCDSQTDEGLTTTYYEDSDSDTYGNALVTQEACTQPGGYAANNTDCNDTNGLINPGATEICDGTDNDCNAGTVDGAGEAAPLNDLQTGVCAGSVKTCGGAGGWQNNYIGVSNYEAVEASCDSLDNDCDSQTDEGLTTTYYEDSDSDTYGNALVTQEACTQPGGYAANNTDCNDTNGLINPGATEICDGTDNDCNAGTVDGTGEAAPDNSNQQGVCAGSKQSCAAGAWTDDYSGVSNYEAVEASCDSLDNDCDSQTDEGLTTTYYEDSDSDTYGNALVTQEACTQPGGYAANNTDCNDTNGLINPGATEICDGTDNDCNAGTVDGTGEAAPDNSNQQGVCAGSKQSCAAGAWTDDYSGVSNYEAVEASCDSLDNDCDSQTDEGLTNPAVSATVPPDRVTAVAVNSNVTITWNENIDCATVNATNITSDSPGWEFSSCNGSQAVFTTSGQAGETTYTVTITTAVTNVSGCAMAANYQFSFTTNVSTTLSILEPNGIGDAVIAGDPYIITYSLDNPDKIVTVAFYYDTDNTKMDGTVISGACSDAPEGVGVTCAWDTTGMSPGVYYVYGITSYSGSGAAHTWTGGGTDDLASNPANWSGNITPQNGDDIIFNGTSTKHCNWDIDVSIHSFSLNPGYTGTVTINSILSMTGNSTISDGRLIAGDTTFYGNGENAYAPGPITIN